MSTMIKSDIKIILTVAAVSLISIYILHCLTFAFQLLNYFLFYRFSTSCLFYIIIFLEIVIYLIFSASIVILLFKIKNWLLNISILFWSIAVMFSFIFPNYKLESPLINLQTVFSLNHQKLAQAYLETDKDLFDDNNDSIYFVTIKSVNSALPKTIFLGLKGCKFSKISWIANDTIRLNDKNVSSDSVLSRVAYGPECKEKRL